MKGIWECKIGFAESLPDGADFPMRRAVQRAFYEVVGARDHFLFSGWGASLDPIQQEVVIANLIRSQDSPQLGLATTKQLLEELDARAEIGGYANYRTISDEA